jgi:hypothetical protein
MLYTSTLECDDCGAIKGVKYTEAHDCYLCQVCLGEANEAERAYNESKVPCEVIRVDFIAKKRVA